MNVWRNVTSGRLILVTSTHVSTGPISTMSTRRDGTARPVPLSPRCPSRVTGLEHQPTRRPRRRTCHVQRRYPISVGQEDLGDVACHGDEIHLQRRQGRCSPVTQCTCSASGLRRATSRDAAWVDSGHLRPVGCGPDARRTPSRTRYRAPWSHRVPRRSRRRRRDRFDHRRACRRCRPGGGWRRSRLQAQQLLVKGSVATAVPLAVLR